MDRKNFLVINAPAMGHLIPLLEFAHRITEHHDVTVTISKSFVPKLTDRNILKYQSNPHFHLLPIDDGLPDDVAKVSNTPGLERILIAMELIRPAVETLLREMPVRNGEALQNAELTRIGATKMPAVDAVIFDHFLVGFVPEAGHQRGVPCFEFVPSSEIRNRSQKTHTERPDEKSAIGKWLALKQRAEPFLFGRIVNNFRESVPPREDNLPTFYVGPLFPLETVQKEFTPAEQKVQTFLDDHPQRSVIYFAFGTVVRAAPAQIAEIHHALTALQRPYIWSLAEPLHQYLPADRQPDGGGHLILPWVPQKLILQHPSVAVFITHAGWNSAVEGLTCGVPMVSWPGFADQHANAAWQASIGVGVTVPETKLGPDARVVPANEIQEWINKAAGWDSTHGVSPFADKCAQWKEIIGKVWTTGGSSLNDFNAFLCHVNKLAT
ncbi:uncharacterized protein LOC129602040 [Paramacrobiotus metropolitanus]|uniref:uncharacterized protein LOC129602040 n=1 Tax=Paramacrobiotus metropolitanus TaxID=2943436 RepID=UPI0024461EE9|nr:uncharacterized protein LOC129602040 [Paramacrobiotus metropolitanus]